MARTCLAPVRSVLDDKRQVGPAISKYTSKKKPGKEDREGGERRKESGIENTATLSTKSHDHHNDAWLFNDGVLP